MQNQTRLHLPDATASGRQVQNNWQTEKLEEDSPARRLEPLGDWRVGILDLAQRIKIAKLILDGKTYDEIAVKVETSTSTVSKIGQIIKYGKGGLEKVLAKKQI